MKKKFLESSRGKVYYWINSNNATDKAIMFTHGVTANHNLFDKQIEFWSKYYTVITWDMPLHGESRPYNNFTFSNVADDMKNILFQEEVNNVVLVGQSAGGYACQAFVLKYPNMVDAFVSVDSTPFGLKYYKNSDLFWTRHYSDIAKLYPYNYYCKVSSRSVAITDESVQSFYDSLVKLGKDGMLEATHAVYNDFNNYEEVDFKCPVLLLIGEYDKTGYVKKYNNSWSKESGFPLIIIPNASHNSNYDNYEFFNSKVYDFLYNIL